jgi:hypothetical protein
MLFLLLEIGHASQFFQRPKNYGILHAAIRFRSRKLQQRTFPSSEAATSVNLHQEIILIFVSSLD